MIKSNIVRFLIIFVLSYCAILFLYTVPFVKKAHISVYNESQQLVFNILHPTVKVDFKHYAQSQMSDDSGEYDISMWVYALRDFQRRIKLSEPKLLGILNFNSRIISVGPFALLLSLVIASPISLKRKLISIVFSSLLVLALLSFKFGTLINAQIDVLSQKNFIWRLIVNYLGDMLRTHEFILICVMIFWIVGSLRFKDYKWFIE